MHTAKRTKSAHRPLPPAPNPLERKRRRPIAALRNAALQRALSRFHLFGL